MRQGVETEREPRLRYRPGLDGLRALAVAGVFLYHARIDWLPGGFLGVDLFLVLSGYLITSLLLAEWERFRRVDLRRFWLRRARRLLPAVVVVILAALVAAAALAPDDFARTRGDAISSLLYVTNWHLIAASHSYFETVGRPSLLQHLWSLAVEEQFYVLWPPVLVLGLGFLGRRGIGGLAVAGVAGSTALMWLLYDPERDPSRVYYGTDTRAATLLVGALLALAWPALARLRVPRAGALVELAGAAALVAVVVVFRRAHDYDPGLYRGGMLAFAACAAVVVAALARDGSRLGALLGREPLRWLGVRSYGIYLWHWPVLALTRPGVDVPWRGAWLVPAQAAVVVALAALSYRFVEQPIRTGALQRRLAARPGALRRTGLGATAAFAALLAALFAAPAPPAHPVLSYAAPVVPLLPIVSLPPAPDPLPIVHPRPRPRPAPTPRDEPVLAVGDSVMLGCSDALRQALGRRLRVDAVVGRQATDIVARLAAYRARGALPRTVVVQLGDNGPAWYADLVRLRETLAGTARVVLVNVRVDRSWQGEVNQELRRFVSTWRTARIADWYGHSSDRVLQDGVHPTPQACTTYASLVAGAVRSS
jgi:peptidoglycan/LPS O-acetylase OafA/YrhL